LSGKVFAGERGESPKGTPGFLELLAERSIRPKRCKKKKLKPKRRLKQRLEKDKGGKEKYGFQEKRKEIFKRP
jgi:hypothetical protein